MHKLIPSRRLRRSLILCISVLNSSPTKAKPTLNVAIEPTFSPFELLGNNSKLDGFDVDLFKAIAKAADFDIKFQTMQFDGA
ncbi:MAG: transporter substrate-binding domain-containing protein [Tolypothrix sp. Co-bin9]|nr:transporter substrate-binding domain-containing protein [Tolypothrix sp. Co-bin9]